MNRELRDTKSKTAKKLGNSLDIGSTRHIELDITNTGLTYETADNLAILPENSENTVNKLSKALGYNTKQMFSIVPSVDSDPKKFKYPFPVPCSIHTALSNYVDIHGIPKHSTVSQLVPYLTDDKQRDWLLNMLSKDNISTKFKEYLHNNGKSMYSLLTNELSSAQVPIEDLLHILPAMQPRYYTISSSSSLYPNNIHITVSITEFALQNGSVFEGVTSGYTRHLDPSKQSVVRAFVRPSSFRLPKKSNIPIIMIGPGTGLAPMRALLQERKLKYDNNNSSNDVPKNTLYFGCKYSDVDYIYKNELESYNDNELTLYTAFSREGRQKVYVQNLMQNNENSIEIMNDIDNGAYIYVCGATAMGADVHNTLISILKSSKGFSQTKAVSYLADLAKNGRYVQELWSA